MVTTAKLSLSAFAIVMLLGLASAQAWNEGLAQHALRLSWAAYCPPTEIAKWTCFWCKYSGTPSFYMVGTTIDGGTATLGYVGHTADAIWVVFRGTTNLKNVLVDVAIKKTAPWSDKKDVKVHHGFLASWNALSKGIRANIATAHSRCPNCKKIIFSGHSLGAAITTIASVDWARNHPSNMNAVAIQSLTLGSPRVGNEEFSDYAKAMVPNTIRWTHSTDPVVHLPPKLLGWRHKTREVWEQTTRSYKTCSTTNSEDSSCANSNVGFSLEAIAAHSSYGGIPLKSGTCETFTKRSDFTDEELMELLEFASMDARS